MYIYQKHSADNETDGSQSLGISWIFCSGNVTHFRGLAALLRNFNFRWDIGRGHGSAEKTELKIKMEPLTCFLFHITWKDPLCASRWGRKQREEESGKRSSFEFPQKGDGSSERNRGNASRNLWFISVLWSSDVWTVMLMWCLLGFHINTPQAAS